MGWFYLQGYGGAVQKCQFIDGRCWLAHAMYPFLEGSLASDHPLPPLVL